MSDKSIFLKKFIEVLNNLEEEFLKEIKFLFLFENINFFIVTNDDKVFAFGSNNYGVLGIGNNNVVNELTLNEDLSNKNILDFKNGSYCVIARTIDDKVYCWGYSIFGILGNGEYNNIELKPQLNSYLSDKQIIDMCCGDNHTLVLTNNGEVYAWGWNDFGQIGNGSYAIQTKPFKVKGFNEKAVSISCGAFHSMALTESGRVFSWGHNGYGQLGQSDRFHSYKPSNVMLSNKILVKKISCGHSHSLLLSRDGDIYWFGYNGYENHIAPKKLEINTNKFIDIASHRYNSLSIAVSIENVYYIWGECGSNSFKIPIPTMFKSFNEVFLNYSLITHTVIKGDSFSNYIKILKKKYEENVNDMLLESSRMSLKSEEIGSFFINFKIFEMMRLELEKMEKLIKEKLKIKMEELESKREIDELFELQRFWKESGKIKLDMQRIKDEIKKNIQKRNIQKLEYEKCQIEYLKSKEFDIDCEEVEKIRQKVQEIKEKIEKILIIEKTDSEKEEIEKLKPEKQEMSTSDAKSYSEEENVPISKYKKDFIELIEIGRGRYGKVFIAQHKITCEMTAIKKIPVMNENESFKELIASVFISEIDIPYIARYHDVWYENETGFWDEMPFNKKPFKALIYIQMDFCDKTLRKVYEEINTDLRLKIKRILNLLGYFITSEIFFEILKGVDYLHKKNIIHRDLKPDNILLNENSSGNYIKIADYGLAKFSEITKSNAENKGTPEYMAPEVVIGKKYDMKADIYSLAVIMEELFNIDINENYEEEEKPKTKIPSKLMPKFIIIKKFVTQMTNRNYRRRPNDCDQDYEEEEEPYVGIPTKLMSKLRNIKDFVIQMTNRDYRRRPHCQQILDNKHLWALNREEFNAEEELRFVEENESNNPFVYSMIITKLRK